VKTVVKQTLSLAVALLSLSLLSCAPKTAPNVTVKTAAARQGRVERRVEFSGVLVPNRTVNIFTKLMGLATTVSADVGDRVAEGQLLVQIDTKELNAQLQVAEAAASGVSDQAAQAKIGMETARLNLELAQRAYDRTKTLLDTKIVTESQLDDAQTKIELAKSAFDNASRQYQTVSGSGLAQAQAQVNSIKVQISNSTISSPISGVVTNRSLNSGEMATIGGPLMSIADVSTLKLQGNVSQEDVVRLTLGDSLKVSVNAIPGATYAGKITQVGPVAAATGQYFPVVVSLRNDGRLLAGMTATATLSLSANQGIVVPLAAVQNAEDGKAFVFVIAEGKARKRPVTLGVGNGRDVLILAGLAEGDNVAVSNAGVLQDGMEVSQ
jgi:HlyD family secretion protein